MSDKRKITTGANDRPVDETIAQSGRGLPDDGGLPAEINEDTVEKVRQRLEGGAAEEPGRGNPDAVPPGTTGSGEDVCRRCGGSGRIGGQDCPDCGGTGKVNVPIGGG